MEELFNIIGKLYVDVYNMQKVIEILQKKLKEKENLETSTVSNNMDERK